VKIGTEKLCHEVASKILAVVSTSGDSRPLHVFQGRNEDIAKADDLEGFSRERAKLCVLPYILMTEMLQ
jgi:hypothetical protein